MNYKTLSLLLFSLLSYSGLVANDGTIRGSIYDGTTGEPLIGVTVLVEDTDKGTVTDFDGTFELQLDPGSYNLQVSYISFETIKVTDIAVESEEVTVIDDIQMQTAASQLTEVIVTAEVIKRSESALMVLKQKSPNLLDGISAANFRKIGDGNAAAAVKRVTGVSVEDGKYVYVRGLGDRYTKTMLNSVDIPGLDPDRNSLQMDIFPTSLIDNIMVSKTFSAELPADFTGGNVNIETKDFPEEKVFDISVDLGYNPSMHFNQDYLTYEGGTTDYLGLDDGTRSAPDRNKFPLLPTPVSGHETQEVKTFLEEFNPTLGLKQQKSTMDYGIGLSLANQINAGKRNKLGYILSLNYKQSTKFYDDINYGEFQRSNISQTSKYELNAATRYNGTVGENSVLLAGLGGLSFKTQNMKLKLTAMHLQNGESRAANLFIDNRPEAAGQSEYKGGSYNLEYNQRALTNLFLSGSHHQKEGKFNIEWRLSPTFSELDDPDIRKTAFTYQSNGDTAFVAGAAGFPTRIWRSLDEINLVGAIDGTLNYNLFAMPAKFKIGGSHAYKEREYEIINYTVRFFGNQPNFNGNPNRVLDHEFLYPNGTLYYSSSIVDANNYPNPNAYQSDINNSAIYISNEFSPFENLKTILGVRGEKFVQKHTGRDILYAQSEGSQGNGLNDDVVIDDINFFPSVNMIYYLAEKQNLRLAWSQTIARPSFKELSFAQILDPVTNRIFNGGLYTYSDWDGKLGPTHINNLDLRWELFMERAQLFSVGAFYKTFDDPIELVRIPEQATSTEYQPRNVGDGQLYGIEIEMRKNLGFVVNALDKFNIYTNVTFVRSEIEMTQTEYNSRKSYEKEGETIDDIRQMAGQAPYIINAGLSYEHLEKGVEVGLFYNVKGKTLSIVGGGLFPDVYANPFHSLNLNANVFFGQDRRSALNFSVSNILNDNIEEIYSAFRATDQVFSQYSPRISFSLGYKYKF